jgi:hypothetical protein
LHTFRAGPAAGSQRRRDDEEDAHPGGVPDRGRGRALSRLSEEGNYDDDDGDEEHERSAGGVRDSGAFHADVDDHHHDGRDADRGAPLIGLK